MRSQFPRLSLGLLLVASAALPQSVSFVNARRLDIPVPFNVISVVAPDVNNDGNPDIVALDNLTSTEMRVWLGNGDGTFRPGPVPVYQVPSGNTSVNPYLYACDFNGTDEWTWRWWRTTGRC